MIFLEENTNFLMIMKTVDILKRTNSHEVANGKITKGGQIGKNCQGGGGNWENCYGGKGSKNLARGSVAPLL